MRTLIAVVVVSVLACGCSARRAEPPAGSSGGSTASFQVTVTASPTDSAMPTVTVHAGPDEQPPADNKAFAHRDSAGRTPSDVVLAVRKAMEARDWKKAYSLYTQQEISETQAADQWATGEDKIRDFRIREERIERSDLAHVRVTYVATSEPSEGPRRVTVFEEPGVWWVVRKTDGLWKLQWKPRQY